MMLRDLVAGYADFEIDPSYTCLYTDLCPTSRMFASFHQRLNVLFDFMHSNAKINGHFNSGESRELLAIIRDVETLTPDAAGVEAQSPA